MAAWNFSLAQSNSMRFMGNLRKASQRKLGIKYCRAGEFSATLPLDDEDAYKLAKHRVCVIAERKGRAIWSGPITSITKNAAAGTVDFSCQGWLHRLDMRFLRAGDEASAKYLNVVGGTIVRGLVGITNAHTDTAGIVRPTGLSDVYVLDTQIRTRQYKRGQNVGAAVRELVDIENGLDIFVDPLSKLITTKAPDTFTIHREVKYGYGIAPWNLEDATETQDGLRTANRFNAVAQNGNVFPVDDFESINDAGVMLEDWVSLSSTSEPTIVAAYGNAEQLYRRFGVTTYSIKPKLLGNSALLPFDHFEPGDQLFFSVNNGAFQVRDQGVRIFTITYDFDQEGNEVISEIGITPSS